LYTYTLSLLTSWNRITHSYKFFILCSIHQNAHFGNYMNVANL
jgi:hypothetical protein